MSSPPPLVEDMRAKFWEDLRRWHPALFADVLATTSLAQQRGYMFNAVKDSGQRQTFDTGSVRDTADGKPRLDLIPPLWLYRLGTHLGNGAEKYGDSNWQRGQPLSRYYASGLRHTLAWYEGLDDEDHFAAAAWNTLAAMWTLEEIRAGRLPLALDDRPSTTGVAWNNTPEGTTAEPYFVPPGYGNARCGRCDSCCCVACWKGPSGCNCERPLR